MILFHLHCRFLIILFLLCVSLVLSNFGYDGFDSTPAYRNLQAYQKTYDESLPLYENNLVLSTSTPWSYGLAECLDGHNWENGTNPDNFTWYGLRLDLPNDAEDGQSSWFTQIGSMEVDRGFNQLYGDDIPLMVANITFRTTESNPTIKINLQGDVLWSRIIFNFDGVEDGDFVQTTRGYSVLCLSEQTETSGTYMNAVDATFTLAMARMQLREGANGTLSASGMSVSLTVWWSISLVISVLAMQALF
ncbi:hypothetical protein IV203_038428 [Nitzschia inconspicua]|uniref:Uncharacterized protein n=1 Tax=Nitzschia inconspicua TaxID=303405 RepID=A0A9K3LML0_9STRA|nr:hypothetical protein IV203_038428 [Nitzschia inconspicua]